LIRRLRKMALGAPRVSLSALAELHLLLIEHGFGRHFLSHSTIVQEVQDGTPVVTPTLPVLVSRQLIIPFESGRPWAQRLGPMDGSPSVNPPPAEATDVAVEERDDDER
jgi:hypothetical protein